MNIVFCGGGTVGHISPAIAIAKEFEKRNPDCKIAFIGRASGAENEIIKKNGYKLYEIQVSGLIRKLTLKNLGVIKKLFTAEKESKKILEDFSADAVIGTGGYVCFPVVRAAKKLGIFTAIHESNASPGLSAKLLSKKCDIVFYGTKTDNNDKNSIYSGNPVREDFYKIQKSDARKKLGIPSDKLFVLSVGGSIGAWALNDASLEMMKDFSSKRNDILHCHSTGKRYFESVKETHPELFPAKNGCSVVPFIDEMPLYLAAADIVISRCGAMTLSEICASGSASILIPSPNVTADHQTKNALHLVENGAAVLINESELSAESLTEALLRLINNRELLSRMEKNAFRISSPNASRIIAKNIENHILCSNKNDFKSPNC